MREFWYMNISDYLEKADAYNDPKYIKLYETADTEEGKEFRAYTYLRTSLIGYRKVIKDNEDIKGLELKCIVHGHKSGIMFEVSPIR